MDLLIISRRTTAERNRLHGGIDDAFRLQRLDPCPVVTENRPEDLLGMLSETGCGSHHLSRGFRQTDRGAGDPDRADIRLVDRDEHVPVADDLILADLLDVVDP